MFSSEKDRGGDRGSLKSLRLCHLLFLAVFRGHHSIRCHPSILLSQTNSLQVLHYQFSSFLLGQQLHISLSLTKIFAIPPLYMFNPSSPRLSNFVSKLLSLSCPSNILIFLSCRLRSLPIKLLAFPPSSNHSAFINAMVCLWSQVEEEEREEEKRGKGVCPLQGCWWMQGPQG